jgi:hypothetical protein
MSAARRHGKTIGDFDELLRNIAGLASDLALGKNGYALGSERGESNACSRLGQTHSRKHWQNQSIRKRTLPVQGDATRP